MAKANGGYGERSRTMRRALSPSLAKLSFDVQFEALPPPTAYVWVIRSN
ncbi:MAG: hypothetical protein ACLU0O_08285 [Collinsella sp.]